MEQACGGGRGMGVGVNGLGMHDRGLGLTLASDLMASKRTPMGVATALASE